MGRYYRLSKKISDEETSEIVKEVRELEDVREAEITKDYAMLKIVTQDDQYAEVMAKTVNICKRLGNNLEVTFAQFAV
ncbi:MAG: hypothetical protein Q4G60_12305 [bacterium]|nr:hypothetical protein [bacterium]